MNWSKNQFQKNGNFYLRKGSENISIYQDPLRFLDTKIKDNERLLINLIQNQAHSLLYKYLNPEIVSGKDFFKNTIQKGFYDQEIKTIKRLVGVSGGKFEKTREATDLVLNSKMNLEKYLTVVYGDLRKLLPSKSTIKKKVHARVKLQDWQKETNDSEFLLPARELVSFLNKEINKYASFFFHGSIATLDYIEGYSDFDTLVLIKHHTLEEPAYLRNLRETLIKARSYMFLLDRYQHHGVFVLTEIDMLSYPQSYFPLTLFDYSVEITGSNDLKFFMRDSKFEVKQSFLSMNQYFRKIRLEDWRPDGFFQLKFLVQIIALLPINYLQVKNLGEFFYKKDSFDIAKTDFSLQKWIIMNRISKFRDNVEIDAEPFWYNKLVKKNPLLGFYLNLLLANKIPDSANEILGLDYLVKTLNLSEAALDNLPKGVFDD